LVCLALLTGLFFLIKKRRALQAEALKQEQFTFQLLQNTEEERSRIANELHDSVNHNLLTLKNNLSSGKIINVSDLSEVIEEVRNISRNLHPAVLETIGLEASIENLCERLTEIGLFTTCEIEYHQKLSKNKELQLYRIIQEALNNTLKHGKANAAKVILTSNEAHLQLEVKDNGNGFDVSQQLKNPKSFGLQSIIQRAKAIAAKININSSDKGTVILLKIPI
jgi:signal transduction histidine kinase